MCDFSVILELHVPACPFLRWRGALQHFKTFLRMAYFWKYLFLGTSVFGEPVRATGETHEAVSWSTSTESGTAGEPVPSAETTASQG